MIEMATSDEHAEFCERVKARRKELGLTQVQMAERLGVTQPTYAAFESGRFDPKLSQIIKVAGALELTLSEILQAGAETH
jgi:transcriptional regulator with XRE-family HTH domain